MLEIDRSGPGVLQHWMNIIFETDLPPTLDGREPPGDPCAAPAAGAGGDEPCAAP